MRALTASVDAAHLHVVLLGEAADVELHGGERRVTDTGGTDDVHRREVSIRVSVLDLDRDHVAEDHADVATDRLGVIRRVQDDLDDLLVGAGGTLDGVRHFCLLSTRCMRWRNCLRFC